MTERETPPSEESLNEHAQRSGWGTFAKVLLYLIAGGIVLILVVFGTCVLGSRK